ncbi:hypothetical protein BD311DRAFT_71839 [Dichomitus squalens]|uniref:Uncharacterized protein n=1 Tax=Dichomitus squalens TaxID=114155 RepID=A0A4Q9M900_9APHY|nr:hypothetical protein BD311DRAFT_71839 [Dichomitus squalens]TBU63526.1 hypothetical protein BD310DRAFT_808820 [Dichomitus squalens]
MGDSAGVGVLDGCCAIFCIQCTEALQTFCFFNRSGSGSNSNTQAGCCGACCNKAFDEDDFQAQNGGPVKDQPAPQAAMSDKPDAAPVTAAS